jgi:hypothetical protein
MLKMGLNDLIPKIWVHASKVEVEVEVEMSLRLKVSQ